MGKGGFLLSLLYTLSIESSSLNRSLIQVFQVINPIETARAAASFSGNLQNRFERDLTLVLTIEETEKPEVYQQQKSDFAELVRQLGEPGVNDRVAQMVMEILNNKNEIK